jgi:hypothetical protein
LKEKQMKKSSENMEPKKKEIPKGKKSSNESYDFNDF